MRKIGILLISCAFLTGCATVYNEATGRKEMVMISSQEEMNIGANFDTQVLKEFKLSDDYRMNERLLNVGSRVARVSDRQDVQYHFKVVMHKEINAFAIPGGYVYATTALMDAVESDDELAGVVSHEVGHIAARHPIKKVEASFGYSLLSQLAVVFLNPKSTSEVEQARQIQGLANTTYKLIELGYSRKDEMAADLLALRYSKKAGYEPKAILTFMEKLLKKESPGSEWLVFLRSHPHTKERIAAIKKELEESGDL